ncbi:MAG: 4-hydroxy-3-methylbut-2-enyl diphosphate reductase [Chlorobi bacterium]|nr:4-hydroxy-3-methylbut-2-enyl diphosphate reductase [Chlorobiota bacterium]
MNIEIDKKSGFCFGVVYAIQMAEENLKNSKKLYCLGDIVHNNMEVERLNKLGLVTIDHEKFKKLKNCKVLIRAHGEPPETYKIAFENNIQLIDASCPVVLKLQNKIQNGYNNSVKSDGQIVIYGKQGHAEVNGLVGQTEGKAIVVNSLKELDEIDFNKSIYLYSQTTQSKSRFEFLQNEIKKRSQNDVNEFDEKEIVSYDTICRQVSSREPELKNFAKNMDVIIFASGKKSSNGKILYDVCKSVNSNTYFVSNIEDLSKTWFKKSDKIGICGATSTPMWLMETISEKINSYFE